MSLDTRQSLYAELEKHRNRPLIVYVTSKRPGISASMASDAIPFLMDQLDVLPSDAKAIDFLIVSLGGDPMVAWRIMSLLHGRFDKVSVLVPQSAYSAATLLALGANEILMHPNSHLGPVDMQISTMSEGGRIDFSTEDISCFIEFVRESLSITDQRHLRKLFEQTCREVGTLGVGFTARSSKLAVALGRKMLAMHLPEGDDTDVRLLVEKLSRHFHSHAWPVSRKEAIEIGLRVEKNRDEKTESLMWKIWLDLENELKEREVFSPVIELTNSKAATHLFSPVPQLNMPMNVSEPSGSVDMAEVAAGKKDIDPIDFEYLTALIESHRLAYACGTKGKILAARQPDLKVQYNVLATFRGWKKTSK